MGEVVGEEGREEARRVNARPAGISGRGGEEEGAPPLPRGPRRAPPRRPGRRGDGVEDAARRGAAPQLKTFPSRKLANRSLVSRCHFRIGLLWQLAGRTTLCSLSLRARCGGSARRQLYPLKHRPQPRQAALGGLRAVQRPVRTGSATEDYQPLAGGVSKAKGSGFAFFLGRVSDARWLYFVSL